MKILAADTATRSCSVALIDNSDLICEQTLISGQTHSRHLMDMIKKAFDLADLTINDLDGFAVTIGPGTFTGLRIGISSMKGLAAAAGKPVAGISSLKALAAQSSFSGHVCAMIDARRGEVYSGRYSVSASGFNSSIVKQESAETVMTPEQTVSRIDEPTLFIGNGAFLYQQKIKAILGCLAIFPSLLQNTIQASTIARLGMEQLQKKYHTTPHPLIPSYIRASDAEKMRSNR
ncbi:MAG: tRNA (adenosine(37)-N6)-threonylcarbamoyltransferase complex dimerization subunit type 1 TsaB [Desulfosarcina sp.]|nr:tRNA (adenosine(37)-N6)-threonylcarbamoyltransferase complex dimerization subunit type 1 TsaB [Desulfobacterales bacterium]